MLKPENADRIRLALTLLGGAGLMLAMFIDTIAVAGRHLGLPLVGSIEIFKALAAIAAVSALMLATFIRNHAHVHFLTDRLPKAPAEIFDRLSAALSMMFCIALFVGSAWLFLDMLPGHEESEVIRIPYAPLRFLATLGALVSAVFFAGQIIVLRRRK